MAQKGIVINTVKTGHVDATDFAMMNDSFIGGSGIAEYKNKLAASKVNDNTIRILDGVFMLEGRAINVENYIDLNVESGTLGSKRYDYIIAEYEKDGIEIGTDKLVLKVLKGSPSTTAPNFPTLINTAIKKQVALYSLYINGTTMNIVSKIAVLLPPLKGVAKKEDVYTKTEIDKMCEIIKSGSQEAWKYSDGRLIITMKFEVNVPTNIQWGVMYISTLQSGMKYVVDFIDTPALTMTAMYKNLDYLVWCGTAGNYANIKTKSPNFYIIKESVTASTPYIIMVSAIGRWK